MGFWKRLDNKIKSFLENQIEKQDIISAEIERSNSNDSKSLDNQNQPHENINDIGMYFMELHDIYKKSGNHEHRNYILDFYWLLGCSSQGRKNEVDEILKEAKAENSIFYSKIRDFEPQIIRMTKISKKIDESGTHDMKAWESVGEYQSRKLSKSKAFMKDFDFFKNLEIEQMFD